MTAIPAAYTQSTPHGLPKADAKQKVQQGARRHNSAARVEPTVHVPVWIANAWPWLSTSFPMCVPSQTLHCRKKTAHLSPRQQPQPSSSHCAPTHRQNSKAAAFFLAYVQLPGHVHRCCCGSLQHITSLRTSLNTHGTPSALRVYKVHTVQTQHFQCPTNSPTTSMHGKMHPQTSVLATREP